MSTTRWIDMPPDVANALGNTPMRAAVREHAGSIMDGTIPYSMRVRKPHKNCPRPPERSVHRGRCPKPIDHALMPLLVEYVYDCLGKRNQVPPHAAKISPVQLAQISRTTSQQLAKHGYIGPKESLQVTTGIYGLAAAILGNNVQAYNVASLWLKHYLERVLAAYDTRR
jgi:hypothetical protein